MARAYVLAAPEGSEWPWTCVLDSVAARGSAAAQARHRLGSCVFCLYITFWVSCGDRLLIVSVLHLNKGERVGAEAAVSRAVCGAGEWR